MQLSAEFHSGIRSLGRDALVLVRPDFLEHEEWPALKAVVEEFGGEIRVKPDMTGFVFAMSRKRFDSQTR